MHAYNRSILSWWYIDMLLTSINCKEHHTQEEILAWCQVSRCSTLPVSEHYTINGLMVGVSLPENRQKM